MNFTFLKPAEQARMVFEHLESGWAILVRGNTFRRIVYDVELGRFRDDFYWSGMTDEALDLLLTIDFGTNYEELSESVKVTARRFIRSLVQSAGEEHVILDDRGLPFKINGLGPVFFAEDGSLMGFRIH